MLQLVSVCLLLLISLSHSVRHANSQDFNQCLDQNNENSEICLREHAPSFDAESIFGESSIEGGGIWAPSAVEEFDWRQLH